MRTYMSLEVWGLALCLQLFGCSGSIGNVGSNPDDDSAGDNRPPKTGGAGGAPYDEVGTEAVVATTRSARLSHKQWENTVRDLLRLPLAPGLSTAFTGDSASGRFDNAGGALQVTEGLFVDYQQAAEALATRVFSDAALRATLLPANLPGDATDAARAFVQAFGKRAFRRPLTPAEVDAYAGLYSNGVQAFGEGDATAAGVRAVVEAMLQSPHFLYRIESGVEGSARVALNAYELASRLSYALANTMPDDELFAAAAEGRLEGGDDEVRAEVRAQAARLLSGNGGKEAVRDFYSQLLRLHTYEGIDKDPVKVPGFSRGIGLDMKKETLSFVAEVINQQGGGVTELYTAPYTFVNKRLALIYGVEGSFGVDFQKVQLNPEQRAGLLTQSGFLAVNAYSSEIDSIHRGVFVHNNVLCTDLPAPPPGDIPPLPEAGGKTNRERVTLHTGPGTCGGACHSQIINPAGFAFENYDAIGKYRSQENGNAIDASGEMDVGEPSMKWSEGVQFVKLVAKHPATHRCMTRAWLEYLYGRRPVDADEFVVEKTATASLSQNTPMTELVMELVTRDSFLYRAAP